MTLLPQEIDILHSWYISILYICTKNLPNVFILNTNSSKTSLSCKRSSGKGGNCVLGSPVGVGAHPNFHTIPGILA